MKETGYIIGYDLNEKNAQISYYDDQHHEPKTLEVAADNYQIPLMICKHKENWVYGREAKRLETIHSGSDMTTNLYEKALKQEKVQVAGQSYDAVWLLAKFVELTLQPFRDRKIAFLVFSVPKTGIDIQNMLKGIGIRLGIAKERIYVQDYKESFCHYMLYQPKELWQYESALFYCDREKIEAYMLRKLNTDFRKGREVFVTVDKVAQAEMEELEAVYPVLNVDKAKKADERFKHFIQSVFDKKMVSSVFLTGEGFENNWYPMSLRVLCNGRRAFMGNNLYSKGACYCAYRKTLQRDEGPIYLDETKMTEQICLKMRINGEDEWYPIVSFGSHWYESDRQWDVLLENTDDIEIHIESLTSGQWRVEPVSFEGLPKRKEYSVRLKIMTVFQDEHTCRVIFTDDGFGDFYPATDFQVEKVIRLGGSNGQFNSLS